MKIFVWAALLVLTPTLGFAGPWFAGSSRAAVEQIHQAYLEGEFKEMMVLVKGALMDNALSELERHNVLQLVDRAYAVNRGRLPADWRLPSEVPSLSAEVIRRDSNGKVRFSLLIKGNSVREQIIHQLRIVKYPDTVVLDKLDGVGEWEDSVWLGQPEFSAETDRSAAKIADGLYLLTLTLDNGDITKGWFVLNNMNSSASPVVHEPEEGQVFHTRKPRDKI